MDTFEKHLFVLYREVVLSLGVKMYCIDKGPQSVSFTTYLWGLNCTSIIEKGPQSVSFIERLSSLRRLNIIDKEPPSVIENECFGLQSVSFSVLYLECQKFYCKPIAYKYFHCVCHRLQCRCVHLLVAFSI